jgi:LmbE family N-acetylglucosaminyl deacetylase
MTVSLQLFPHDRVLVFVPHPDDETLAAGELIQSALAAGARVRVVFATDGDNNPWPQRWLERRWHIGPLERARWGKRRRCEAIAALAVLGVAGSAVRFLGWPDQELTECLMRDDTGIAVLAQEISGFAPTHVALPALADRHPDHSALRVMLDLALLRTGSASALLGYIVHGLAPPANPRVIASDEARQKRKQQAMQAHASQIALSRQRLLKLAARRERFDIAKTTDAALTQPTKPTVIRIPHRPRSPLHRCQELLLVLATGNEILRFRAMLPRSPSTVSAAMRTNEHEQSLSIGWAADTLEVTLPATAAPLVALYAKLDRVGPRLVIFDRERWRDAVELLQGPVRVGGREEAAASLI